jgi:probable rRNA maturation factor
LSVLSSWQVAEAPLTDEQVTEAVEAALNHGGRPGIGIEVVFVDDPTLTDLHQRALNDPTPTDVITFDLGEDGGGPAGELYVSVDCARREAQRRDMPVARELALYLVHGALHLCGYDDHEDDERARMRVAEREVLAQLGYPDDSTPHDIES